MKAYLHEYEKLLKKEDRDLGRLVMSILENQSLFSSEQEEIELAIQEDAEVEQFVREYEAAIEDREPFFPEKTLFCFN